jgi:hypothetical protein
LEEQGFIGGASSDSFQALSNLCGSFLKWNRFSIRSMRPRAILEWDENAKPWQLAEGDPQVQVVPHADGPLVEVVRRARLACDRVPSGSGVLIG